MKTLGMAMLIAAGTAMLVAPARSAPAAGGHGQAIITVLPENGPEQPVNLTPQDISVSVGGHPSDIASWEPLQGEKSGLELVFLIDNSAGLTLGNQLPEIAKFINSMPENVKVGVAYMENGRAAMAGPLSADHAQIEKSLHLPNGFAGSSGSPYFCLSDLAQHWPSNDHAARHEVILITDGIDTYNRGFDLNDLYLQAAVNHTVRAGLVVYSIYWRDRGGMDRSSFAATQGQSLISQVTQATGGGSYWIGTGNPVSVQPYLKDISVRLKHQFRLRFDTSLNGKPQIEQMSLKVGGPAAKVYAPHQVYVMPLKAQSENGG
ncbi:MAG TPA: hypothetical protein VFE01_08430 [Terracidiphilus sp.]|jgi:hypothetical protein|nr:hypothetical protein [Terracidiphilus sp.]